MKNRSKTRAKQVPEQIETDGFRDSSKRFSFPFEVRSAIEHTCTRDDDARRARPFAIGRSLFRHAPRTSARKRESRSYRAYAVENSASLTMAAAQTWSSVVRQEPSLIPILRPSISNSIIYGATSLPSRFP